MTKLAFTGDIAFTKFFSESCGDERLLDNKTVEFLSSADYTVVNMEGAVNSGPAEADKPLTHANPPESVEWIKKINGNIWNLANNHLMDCGLTGLKSTLEVTKNNNVRTIGAGMDINAASEPLIIDSDGGIGIIAVTYFRQNRAGADEPGCFVADTAEDEKKIENKIREIKAKNRWCIVVSHVGQEFSQMPLPFVRERYKRYLEYGADVIVGHHSHVVQNYEKFGDKTVFYSLGNFIFDTEYQRRQSYTDYGMLIKIDFNENDYSWEFLPVKNDRETMRISSCDTPAIFRNITSSEYRILWPLAAKHLYINERKKNTFHHPEYGERSWFDWFWKFDIKRCNKPLGREVLLGRFLSLFGLWKRGDKATINYLMEK